MITLYTKNNCQQCKMVKRYLEAHEVLFTEVNISQDNQALLFLKEQGFQSVPVLFHNEEIIVGFAPEKLKKLAS